MKISTFTTSLPTVYNALKLTPTEGVRPPFTTTASSVTHHLDYGKISSMRI